MTEQGFYNFSQYKSKDLGHHNVVHLLQNPTPLIIKAISLGIFFFSVVFLSFIDSTPLHFLVSLSISILFYFLAKFCWARKLLSPFNIPLWGDFESMILKTVIIPEMTENEKNIFKSILQKNLSELLHLKKYNFITITRTKAHELMGVFISFDEIQTCVNYRLNREKDSTH